MPNSYFRPSRNVELSFIYFIETNIAADWSGITVVKRFTDAYKATLPVISVSLSNIVNDRKEIGSTTLDSDYTIAVDIFAKSDGQRLDLADYLLDKIKDGCIYYTHSQTPGTPDTLTRVAAGFIHISRFTTNYKVDLGEEGTDTYDRFRHYIEVSVRIV